jgi:hypothetical protein
MSVYFDQSGLREYLVISPTNSNLALTDNFTIEFFVKQQEASTLPSTNPLLLVGYISRYDVSTNLSFFTSRSDNINRITIFLGSTSLLGTRYIGDNLWHHVAVVRNNLTSMALIRDDLPAKSKLRAYYTFESNSVQGNQIANYASGSPVYNATLMNGASINTTDYRRGNGSLQFNASSSQYLQLPTFTYSSEGTSFAIWFKSNNSAAWTRIMDFGIAEGNKNVLITVNNNGTNLLSAMYNNLQVGGTLIEVGDNVNYNNNVWTHVVLTMNPTTGEWKTYINGVLNTTKSVPYPLSVQNNFAHLGKSLYAVNPYFNGLMDEYLMYDTVLTAQDVSQIYLGSNLTLYVDGISDGKLSSGTTIDYNTNGFAIGLNDPGTNSLQSKFKGNLSNLRIVKGTAVYTSNFIPPTSALTSISGTSLLLFNNPNNLFVDGSPNNYTVTKYTSPNFPTASTDEPFVTTGYLTSNGTDLSSIFSAGSSLLTNENTGTRSGATTYTIPFLYDRYPGQVIFYTNGPTYSGALIANMYWGGYSNSINTIVNIGNAFSSVTCFYSAGEFITITMNAGVTQEIIYYFRRM